PDPVVGVQVLPSYPACLKVGGRFFGESGQKDVLYLLGQKMTYLRPEFALTQWVPPERLEAIIQAAMTLVVPNYRVTMDLRSVDAERQALHKVLSEPARAHLAQLARAWLPTAGPGSVRAYIEGADLTAARAGYFAAGDAQTVRQAIQAESGAGQRTPAGVRLRELTTFGVSDDLRALRQAAGVDVQIQVNR